MPIRSGRFTSEDATTPQKLVKGRAGALYRILNSGENAFTLSDGSNTVALSPRFSIDIAVSSDISVTTSMPETIEGIYDYLNTDRSIRSGRFRKTLTTAQKHTIIDLRGGGTSKPTVYYRVFNSGNEPFNLVGGTTVTETVRPEQSFDFEVPAGGPRDIYVQPLNDDKEIEGIYDYLGQS
ncbi:hypothetical protein Mal4_55650 [Maioricimonas rarisocia]|uniref:Uncharacterized protein n=1 Tax=Maioricimonas rarisocia TaxID=2528026 RepID=A0A517ZFD3_9PLAN|nr:hypothetical protein [Maioricimonas rarisocia]QDU41200.1 hypothetical protein Mal4_55650 [Maioricimonas rarisocia]